MALPSENQPEPHPERVQSQSPMALSTGSTADPLKTVDHVEASGSTCYPPLTQDHAGETKRPTDHDYTEELRAAFGDRYRLGEKLGSGGFGAVFRAHDQRLNRLVALKVSRSASDPDQLLREARALAQLRHGGIVAVHDVAVAGQFCFVVSELLPGPSLSEWLEEKRPPVEEAVQIVASVADALAHAHARSIVHRDVKPSNIVFAEGGQPVLVDFGMALSDMDSATERGVISGTPAYMSPEQADGRAHRPDGRTDVYGLAATLYAMLCGRPPFRGASIREVLQQVREDEPQPPRQLCPVLSIELEWVCLKGMAKLPGDRFTTAADFAEALRRSILPIPASPAPAPAPHATPAPPARAVPRSPEPLPKAPPVSRTERRQITLLQCSCESQPADDDDPMERVNAFQTVCAEVVGSHGGMSLQASGSAFLACFGYPVAHEDAPRQAVRAAMAICQRGVALVQTVAVGTGSAVITENPPAAPVVVGDVVAVTSALLAQGSRVGVAVTDTTHKVLKGYFDCEPDGEVLPRGAASPVPAHRVTGEREVRSRMEAVDPARLSPLVGRDREVALLRERWELAAEGVRNVILLVADPGLGKSRLVRTLKDIAVGSDGADNAESKRGDSASSGSNRSNRAVAIEWFCSPYHLGSPFYPVTDYFDRAYQLGREPDPGRRLDLLVARLRTDGVHDPEELALFAAMLSVPAGEKLPPLALSPDRQKERTVEVVLGWLAARAASAPVLFVVEDLHWVDPSTEALLSRFVEDGGETRVLGVFTFRPEYDPPWKGKAVQTQVALNRLTRSQVGELVRAQAGPEVPAAVVDQIVERTDGVPLFVEEFTRLVVDGGKAGLETAIPTSLHDLLLARLDRMASDREVVQLGATIGRTFGYDIIRAATDRDESVLRSELRKLVDAGLLFPKGTFPRVTYTFKHALIQDAAYQSLVKKTRQQLHGRVAAALEKSFPDIVATQPELVAHHLGEAGETARSVEYWLQAGDRTQRRSAHLEAIRHMTRGLDAVARLPDGPERIGAELRFRLLLSGSYLATQGYAAPTVETEIQRAKVLGAQIDPGGATGFGIDMVIWALRFIRCQNTLAKQISNELLAFAKRPGMEGFRGDGYWSATCSDWWAGRNDLALAAAEQGLLVYHAETAAAVAAATQQNCGPLLAAYSGLSLWSTGRRRAAWARLMQGVDHARSLSHPSTLAVVIFKPGTMARLSGEGDEAERWADELLALCAEHSFKFWAAEGAGLKGAAFTVQGRHAEAVPWLSGAIAGIAETGSMKVTEAYGTYLAESLWEIGDRDGAWAALDRAFADSAKDDSEHGFLPEMHRRKAHFLAAGDPAASEAEFARAIAIAEAQNGRYLGLRSAIDLGRVWATSGRNDAAVELVGRWLASIPESGDTPDEVRARSLLSELGCDSEAKAGGV